MKEAVAEGAHGENADTSRMVVDDFGAEVAWSQSACPSDSDGTAVAAWHDRAFADDYGHAITHGAN